MQRAPLFAGSALAVLLLTACGGGGGGGLTTPAVANNATATPTTAPTTAATNPPTMPSTATIGSTNVLVGQNGHTLYVFSIDTMNVSNCTSSNGCTGVWPPYAAPTGTTVPSGTSFNVFMRSDGTLQWALNGQPLYEYSGDTAAGTASGNGIVSFGGSWSEGTPASSVTSPTPTPYSYMRIRN